MSSDTKTVPETTATVTQLHPGTRTPGRGVVEHIRRDDHPDIKLRKLLQVAAACFNECGFSGTSLKDIARQLGRTDAALYYYVRNKEELVFLCYSRALDLGERALQRAMSESTNAREALELYVRYQLLALCGPDGPVAVLSEVPALKASHRHTIMERWKAQTRSIVELIEKGVQQGSLRADNPAIAADVLLGAINWVPKWYRSGSRFEPDAIAEGFIQTLIKGLVPD